MMSLSVLLLIVTFFPCYASTPQEDSDLFDTESFCPYGEYLDDEYDSMLEAFRTSTDQSIHLFENCLTLEDLIIIPTETMSTNFDLCSFSNSCGATSYFGCYSIIYTTSTVFASEGTAFSLDFTDVADETLAQDALTRNDFQGSYEDYLALHCLIKKYQPKTLFEIGTYRGDGTLVIKNAVGNGTVYSLELPPNVPTSYSFLDPRDVGSHCYLPYIQLFGDSMTYDYTKHYPLDAWFIDGEHNYAHVFHESTQALLSNPSLCLWHNTDIPEVFQAIVDTFGKSSEYTVYRVLDTRITYAIKKSLDDKSR